MLHIFRKMEILRSTAGIFGIRGDKNNLNETERRFYREAFNNFDWNGNGKISYGSLLPAMRRVGVNPTEVEVHDLINKIDDGTGVLTFEDFCSILQEKNKEFDSEQHYKVTSLYIYLGIQYKIIDIFSGDISCVQQG